MSKLKRNYELHSYSRFQDKYGQLISEYAFDREVEMIVVIKKDTKMQDGLSCTVVENLGLTVDKDIQKGMKLIDIESRIEYIVNFVNNVARLAQLDLVEVQDE